MQLAVLAVLVVLAIVWAIVLVPPMLRGRDATRPADSIGAFNRQLAVLGRGHDVVTPRRSPSIGLGAPARPAALAPADVRKRRRDVLSAMLAATAGSLLLGLLPGLHLMLLLGVGLAALTAGYVALLVRLRNEATNRRAVVRPIHVARRVPQPAPVFLRRVAD